jgi:hypothetical protein
LVEWIISCSKPSHEPATSSVVLRLGSDGSPDVVDDRHGPDFLRRKNATRHASVIMNMGLDLRKFNNLLLVEITANG